MKTIADCVNQLKSDLESITDAEMEQSYYGLDVPLLETPDSEQARAFFESLQNYDAGGDKPSFKNPYSTRSLQALWNLADILEIACT